MGQKDPLEKGWLLNPVFLGFPCGSTGTESACNAGDLGSVPGLGRSPGEGTGYPRQYSGLENSMGSQRVGHDRENFTFFQLSCFLDCSESVICRVGTVLSVPLIGMGIG